MCIYEIVNKFVKNKNFLQRNFSPEALFSHIKSPMYSGAFIVIVTSRDTEKYFSIPRYIGISICIYIYVSCFQHKFRIYYYFISSKFSNKYRLYESFVPYIAIFLTKIHCISVFFLLESLRALYVIILQVILAILMLYLIETEIWFSSNSFDPIFCRNCYTILF